MVRSGKIHERLASLTRQVGKPLRPSAASQSRKTTAPPPLDSSVKQHYLSESQLFAGIPPEEHTWLSENTTMITCEQGRVFYSPDETAEVVFILKQGKVDLYRISAEGRKLVTSSLGPETVFGEMGLIGQGMYGCFAEATDDCLLCVLSKSDLKALIQRNPQVGLNLLDRMGQRLQAYEAEMEALAFRGLPARLAALLLREADAHGTVTGLSHQDLAERLGTYRETISQIMGRFRADQLVTVEPRRITIVDRAGLLAIAEG